MKKQYKEYTLDGKIIAPGCISVCVRLYKYTEWHSNGFIHQQGEIDYSDNRCWIGFIEKDADGKYAITCKYTFTNENIESAIKSFLNSWGDCYKYFRAINRAKRPESRKSILKIEL